MLTRKLTLLILLSLPLLVETARAQYNIVRLFRTVVINPYPGSAGYMLLHLFRGNKQPLTASYIGRQALNIYGYDISSTFFPKGHQSSIAPPRSEVNDRLPLSGIRLNSYHYNQFQTLAMPDQTQPLYLHWDVLPVWHMLIQYLLGQMPGQPLSYYKLSNPLHHGGTPIPVMYHLINTPNHFLDSAPKNSAAFFIDKPTHLFTASSSQSPPVCNFLENEHGEAIVPDCVGGTESPFVQFTPMNGRIGSIDYDGIGFMSTDDGIFLFLTHLMPLRPHFNFLPAEHYRKQKNDTNDDEDDERDGLGKRTAIPHHDLPPQSVH